MMPSEGVAPVGTSTDFCTIMEACAIAKVSRRTIYNWIDQSKLTTWRTAGGAIRLNPRELVVPVGGGD